MTRTKGRAAGGHCLVPAVLALLLLPALAKADWSLSDWSAVIDGTTYNPPALPASVNSSGFDFTTGLGSLVFTFSDGTHAAGVYFYGFFDHGDGIDHSTAYGTASGTNPTGLSWEMDWPGFLKPTAPPTVFDDFAANALTNANGVAAYAPLPNACCSVAMAAIQAFNVNSGDTATLTFNVGTTAPSGGFYLQVTDYDALLAPAAPDPSIYLTASLNNPVGPTVVPEPAAIWLLLTACAGTVWGVRRRKA